MHEKIKDFKCDSCEKEFVTSYELKEHVDAVHLHIKRNRCHICNKDFSGTEYYLKEHIKTIHEGKKDYKCELCNRAFASKLTLVQHNKLSHRLTPQ